MKNKPHGDIDRSVMLRVYHLHKHATIVSTSWMRVTSLCDICQIFRSLEISVVQILGKQNSKQLKFPKELISCCMLCTPLYLIRYLNMQCNVISLSSPISAITCTDD